ncbi:phospholipase D-like domain-containing protein [Streptomyces sp. HMX87]|uniref:phospholipase D-like domain-containing protein n=1 Tax=Streptomyces sp. HMX87 TaxID=3390849 RepID=UPI003A8AB57A
MITARRGLRGRSIRVTLLFAMSLLLMAISAPPAAALPSPDCKENGNYEVCFTYGGTIQDLVARKIKAKIDATASSPQSGDYIRVAMYAWTFEDGGYGREIFDSLKRAAQNGVSVRVVTGDESAEVKRAFDDAGIDANYCADACTGETGSMHNKFFLIRKGDTQLVLQSSSNLTLSQAKHAQNLLISRNDPALFEHYLDYWQRLYAKSWTHGGQTWTDVDKARAGTNDLSRVYFYAMQDKTPLVGVLQNVTACTTGNDRIWLEASLFKESTDSTYTQDVAAELKRLVGLGCNVKVIFQKESSKRTLLGYGFPAARLKCDGAHHNKLLLIDAKYAGEWREAVFVGSYNIGVNSLQRSNDTMLRVINEWVTQQYVEQFQALWTNSAERTCDQDV